MRQSVGGFEGGEDAFEATAETEGVQGFVVADADVIDAAGVFPEAVFGADAGIIESGGNGMNVGGLAVVVGEDVAEATVEYAGLAGRERSGVFARRGAAAAGLDADEANGFVGEKGMKDPGGVAAAADAGDDDVGKTTEFFEALGPGFLADHRLEIADDEGEWVRPHHAADDVMSVLDGRHPVTHRLVDGVAQRARTFLDGDDLGAKLLHAEDIEFLAADVFGAHVDFAFEPEERRRSGRGNAVLTGTRFGDDARFAHSLGEERLADRVVDLVGTGVIEVFTFEINLRAAGVPREPPCEIEGRRTADEVGIEQVELGAERRVGKGPLVFALEFIKGEEEGLRNVAPAVGAEATLAIGSGGQGAE